MKDNINGGEAFAEGGYGCVFRPALKCNNLKKRNDGVSKLMTVNKAKQEYQEVNQFIPIFKKIPNFRSYFMLPYNICNLDKLDKNIDLHKFDKKCKHLVRKNNINSNNINKNLDKLMIINLPDGGMDVQMLSKQLKSSDDFININNSLLNLLKYGIVPMNFYKIYHFDIKDTNILVDDNFRTRLTDWGLSGIIKDKTQIPSVISTRPLQFNLPFSTILFNKYTLEHIKDFYNDKNTNYRFDVIRDFMDKEFKFIKENIGKGHNDYLKVIFNNYIFYKTDYDYTTEVVNYLSEILNYWRHPEKGFDVKGYFFKVYLKNADIWGFLTTYFSFLITDHNTNIDTAFYGKLKQIFVKHLLMNPEHPINVSELFKDLKSLNNILNKNKNIFNFGITKNLKSPEASFLKSTETIQFDAVNTKNKKEIKKILNKAKIKNKTKKIQKNNNIIKKHSNQSNQSNQNNQNINNNIITTKTDSYMLRQASIMKKTKKRIRCPNGTRKNKQGQCLPYQSKK